MLRHPGIYIRKAFYKTGHTISFSTDFRGNVRWKQQHPPLKKEIIITLSITSRTESDWSCYYVWTVQKHQAFPKWFRKSPRTNYGCDKMDEKMNMSGGEPGRQKRFRVSEKPWDSTQTFSLWETSNPIQTIQSNQSNLSFSKAVITGSQLLLKLFYTNQCG